MDGRVCEIKVGKNNQHEDFPSGHPPEYYPRLSLVNFAERTGCSSFRLIWPIITDFSSKGIILCGVSTIPNHVNGYTCQILGLI